MDNYCTHQFDLRLRDNMELMNLHLTGCEVKDDYFNDSITRIKENTVQLSIFQRMNILNLYACLGGNRAKWDEVADIEVTAVENDPELARLYQERFPNDIVIIGDAHEYLLNNYYNFDFIWSSPPCPSHSRAAFPSRKSDKSNHQPCYPDLKLYEEVILLKHYFAGKYCVENVIPYYTPLIAAQKRGRHLYWVNFKLPTILSERSVLIGSGKNEIEKLSQFHEFEFNKYKGTQRKDKIARNLVDYEAGKSILEAALLSIKGNYNQIGLFESVKSSTI